MDKYYYTDYEELEALKKENAKLKEEVRLLTIEINKLTAKKKQKEDKPNEQ